MSGAWTGQLEIRVGRSRRSAHALLAAAIDPEKGSYQLFLADRTTEAMQQQEIERQAKLSSLGEALAGVAHELNNPLSVILAHAQLAQLEAAEGKDPDELLEVIVSESDRMRHLVAELVGFSRKEEAPQRTKVDDILERIDGLAIDFNSLSECTDRWQECLERLDQGDPIVVEINRKGRRHHLIVSPGF